MSVFDYLDYRTFLKEHCEELVKTNQAFSYRYISQKAGIQSSGHLSMIIQGKRNLTDSMARAISRVIKLNRKETSYFLILVRFNQTKVIEEQAALFQEIASYKSSPVVTVLKGQYEFYEKWYYAVVRELVEVFNINDNWAEIAKLIQPPIKQSEAQNAIEVLTRLDMIKKNENGFYKRCDPIITSGKSSLSYIIKQFQIQNLELARTAYERFENEKRELSTLTLSIDSQTCKIIKERLAQVRSEILELARQVTTPTQVYQLNMQLFPLSIDKDTSSNNQQA